jgi:PAS domain S-box-containing protein
MAKVIEFKSGLDWEKVQLTEEIAKEEDFSTVVVNASLDGILTYDLEVRYTLWSPQMERLTGLKSEQVLGKCAFDLFPFLKDAGIDKICADTFRGISGQSPILKYTISETGLTGYTQQQNFPLYNEFGEITGGIAVVRDVTSMKNRFDDLANSNRILENRIQELEELLKAQSPTPTVFHRIWAFAAKPLLQLRNQSRFLARAIPILRSFGSFSD